MTLYEDLGVPKEASRDEIKKAYRDGSKETHPDAGGDPAAFRQLTVAYKILSDDEKRARYDQGESAESIHGAVLTEEQQIHGLLAGLIVGMFDQVDVNKHNVVQRMQDALRKGGLAIDQEVLKAKAIEERWTQLIRRLKPSREDCPIRNAATLNLKGAQKAIADMEAQRKLGDRAADYLNDYGYDFDPPPPLIAEPGTFQPISQTLFGTNLGF